MARHRSRISGLVAALLPAGATAFASPGIVCDLELELALENATELWPRRAPRGRQALARQFIAARPEPKTEGPGDCAVGGLTYRLLGWASGGACAGGEPQEGILADVLELLQAMWWSEVLLCRWADLLFLLARQCLGPRAVPSLADEVQGSIVGALRHVLDRGKLAIQDFANEVDQAQLEFLRQWVGPTLVQPSKARMVAWGSVLMELEEPARFLRRSPRGWWLPRDRSEVWISLSCPDIGFFAMHCGPMLMEATLSPLLSRHRFFIAVNPGSQGLAAELQDQLPFVEFESLPTELETEREAAVFALQAHKRVHAQALADPNPPRLVVALALDAEVTGSGSALAHLWDLERWLLHGKAMQAQGAAAAEPWWDMAWGVQDGFAAGPAVLPCQEGDLFAPSAVLLLLRVTELAGRLISRIADHARGFMSQGFRTTAFPDTTVGALVWSLSDGNEQLWHQDTGPWWQHVRVPMPGGRAAVVCSIGVSAWREAEKPPSLVSFASAAVSAARWVEPRCERFSSGSGYCRFSTIQKAGHAYSSENCGLQLSQFSSGQNADGKQAWNIVRKSTEVFLCPKRVPLALLSNLRAGTLSIANWAAALDRLSGFAARMSDVFKQTTSAASGMMSDQRDGLWLPPALCLPCCAAGIGRLLVVVLRSPFERLRSYFQRSQVSRGRGWETFGKWATWAQTQLENGTDVFEAVQTCGTSSEEDIWTESDALHLRSMPQLLSAASLDLADFQPELAREPETRGADEQQRIFVVRLESITTDLMAVESALCARLAHCGPPALPAFPRTHTSKTRPSRVEWPPEVVGWVARFYAEDLRLGGYPARPSEQRPGGRSGPAKSAGRPRALVRRQAERAGSPSYAA